MNERESERIMKALANRRRIAILNFLIKKKEANVSGIAEHIKLSIQSTSKHLSILASRDIVDKEQRSLEMYYSISKDSPEVIKQLLHTSLFSN